MFGKKNLLTFDMIYYPEIKTHDFLHGIESIKKYRDNILEEANQLILLYMDYACWMDYFRIFNLENIQKTDQEKVSKDKQSFASLLPSESLEQIITKMGIKIMDMIRYAMILEALSYGKESHTIPKILHNLNKFKPNAKIDKYKNISLNLQQFFYPTYLGKDFFNHKLNNDFILHLISLCKQLGFNLKQNLIEPNKIGHSFYIGG